MSIFVDDKQLLTPSDIQVPNPNLLSGTKDFSGDWHKSSTAVYNSDDFDGFTSVTQKIQWNGTYQLCQFEAEEIYTYSAFVKSISGNCQLTCYGGNIISWLENREFSINEDWKRYSVTFRATQSGKASVRFETDYTDTSFKIAGMKLERGNKATDWCPAYSDYATKSDINSLKESIEALKSKVGGGNSPSL